MAGLEDEDRKSLNDDMPPGKEMKQNSYREGYQQDEDDVEIETDKKYRSKFSSHGLAAHVEAIQEEDAERVDTNPNQLPSVKEEPSRTSLFSEGEGH